MLDNDPGVAVFDELVQLVRGSQRIRPVVVKGRDAVPLAVLLEMPLVA